MSPQLLHVEPLEDIAEIVAKMQRGNPTETNDGTYLPPPSRSVTPSSIADLTTLEPQDCITLLKAAWQKGELVDDRKYLMEKIIQTATRTHQGSPLNKQLTDNLVFGLWNELGHPPQSYLGDKFAYRSADGSNNSLLYPHLGAANTPYARSVKPSTTQKGSLPDPEDIFDSIMLRSEAKPHESKISSMMFYLATIIIHDLFRTDHFDQSNSRTSSYLDLSPLYGSVAEEQKLMRTFNDGKLHPDCFSEKRILGFPPGVGAILIMFNRFHNHVVENLAIINEGGRFDKPKYSLDDVNGTTNATFDDSPSGGNNRSGPGHGKTWEKYDEDLFQTGRLVTCGLYMNLILQDYVRNTILNMTRSQSEWQLDPRMDIKGLPMGVGNQVSAEFNLIYRWHSAISERDAKWTEKLHEELFDGKDYKSIDMSEYLKVLGHAEAAIPDAPMERQYKNDSLQPMQRTKGVFDDEELVKILSGSIEDCANGFGPHMVPEAMRKVEILGIQQARQWNLATFNEFRRHFGLQPHEKFSDFSSNPAVADELKRLYDQPDLVELYPGLVTEDAKIPQLASGLCAPFTISRAVLADAVALVRGDRFATIDYHPRQLTNWGFAQASSNIKIANGGVFYKLFYTAFPNHFRYNSVYAHFPFTIPCEMRSILESMTTREGLQLSNKYNFDPPTKIAPPVVVSTYEHCKRVLEDQAAYKVNWTDNMIFLLGPPVQRFMLAGDEAVNAQDRQMMHSCFYAQVQSWNEDVKTFYKLKTEELLNRHKSVGSGKRRHYVDLVRDIGNLVHVHFVSEVFCLPLKDYSSPHEGVFSEVELYQILSAVFTCIFFDVDQQSSFFLHQVTYEATQALGKLLEAYVQSVKALGAGIHIIEMCKGIFMQKPKSRLRNYGVHMIQRLLKQDIPVHDLVWGHILSTAGGMAPNQGQIFAELIAFYLSPERRTEWTEIQRIAQSDDPDGDAILDRYVLEGSRIAGTSAVTRNVEKETTLPDGTRLLSGARIFLHLRSAGMDPTAFAEPEKVKLDRPINSYMQFGWGAHKCLGFHMTRVALTQMLKVCAQLDDLRPVPGPQGQLARRPSPIPGYDTYLTEMWDRYSPFPCSMRVTWNSS